MQKIAYTESKMPSISGLATNPALTAVENKTPNVINLLKRINYDAKISEIDSKYFTTADYNKFTSQTLDEKINKRIS